MIERLAVESIACRALADEQCVWVYAIGGPYGGGIQAFLPGFGFQVVAEEVQDRVRRAGYPDAAIERARRLSAQDLMRRDAEDRVDGPVEQEERPVIRVTLGPWYNPGE